MRGTQRLHKLCVPGFLSQRFYRKCNRSCSKYSSIIKHMDPYTVLPDIPESAEKELEEYSPLVKKLLHNRGIGTEEEARVFLNPSYERDIHDPFLILNMKRAVERILSGIDRNEHIVIYGD